MLTEHIFHTIREFHGEGKAEQVEFRKELTKGISDGRNKWIKYSYRNKYYIVLCREPVGRKVEYTRKEEIIDGLKY